MTNCSKASAPKTKMGFKSFLKGKLKASIAAIAYRSGVFLVLRLLHRHLYGPGIRILYYHRVVATALPPGQLGPRPLTASEFEKHLRHLRRFYNVIRVEEAVEFLASGREFPPNSVVITFDDGYRDNLTVALPALEKHALPAALFVVSGAIDGEPLWLDLLDSWFGATKATTLRFGRTNELSLKTPAECRRSLDHVRSALKSLPGGELSQALAELRAQLGISGADRPPDDSAILNWDELRQMACSRLMTIGAHTVTHRLLTSLDVAQIRWEIEESCRRLAQELHQPIRFFAYPGGAYNSAAQSVVRDAGLVALATGGGGFNPVGSDLSALRRMGPEGRRQSQFVLYLAGWEDLREAFGRKLVRLRRAFKRFVYGTMESVGFFPLLRYLNSKRFVVLLYHGVAPLHSAAHLNDLHVPVENFRRQMRWLLRKFKPISLAQAIAALEGRAPLPRRAVLVTFDDAYRNNLELAWPILKEAGIRPTLFVPTEFINGSRTYWSEDLEAGIKATRVLGVPFDDKWLWLRTPEERQSAFWKISTTLKRLEPVSRENAWKELQVQLSRGGVPGPPDACDRRLTWEELRTIHANGFDVGSHTISHPLLPGLDANEVQHELEGSKSELESRLGTSILAFAYPNGDWNSEVRQLVEKAGYSCAFSTQPETNGPHTDRFLLHRVPINATDSFSEFRSAVSGFGRRGMQPACKILEIGNYPPPECGWARQTKLVTEELAKRGAICEVMNINESRKVKSSEYVDVQNGIDYVFKVLGFALRGYRLHTHVNAESAKGYLLTLAANLIACAVRRPAVTTFHGGLPQRFFPRTDSYFLKLAYRLLFSSAGSIICNSVEIKEAIQSYGTNGLQIVPIPGFSKQYLQFKKRPLPDSAEAFLSLHDRTFFCFVCFRPEYALDALLEGMREFTTQNPRTGFIWLGFPFKELAHVKNYLDRRREGHPENLLLLGNLDHDTYLTLLSRCFAYLRPPACDGVSASVLESMALNVPVIAAENGRRPAGVVTFRFGDAADICTKLRYVAENYDAVKRGTQLSNFNDNVERTAAWLLALGRRRGGMPSVNAHAFRD
jgi:peptidoglycan/xylan/chitin deacetylase (PgdA/CDA1 family)/glycosyltransferase involved in cell wall biosynthesis